MKAHNEKEMGARKTVKVDGSKVKVRRGLLVCG
jgi:hypothetical protein